MIPDMTSINKVIDRMEELARKCNPELSGSNSSGALKERFVDVLDEKQNRKAARGRTNAQSSIEEMRQIASRYADEYNIDEELVRALIQVESGWKPDAVSTKGARGLMQLMPRTASTLGVEDSFDPEENIEGGVKYLSQLTDKYKGDIEKALAAYNAGPTRIDSGAMPKETSRYVKNVMSLYHRYREEE
ncbi:lytic transglycosylase [Synergistales bacterium]|nr:lytic transglycosylase [Synergistales bacterium]